MPSVDIRMGNIQWPPRCCRCGSEKYSHRTHTDKVVVRTLLSVTEYRKINLNNVPICDRCANARLFWFGAAIVCGAFTYIIFSFAKDIPAYFSNVGLALSILGVVLAIAGVYKSPIKILKFDEKKNSIRIRIYNREIARQMSILEAARKDLPEHSEYLEIQQKKQKKQEREAKLTIRILCFIGFMAGLILILGFGINDGYLMIIISMIFGLIFEAKRLLTK
jgi:hypothetical protein